MRWIYIGFVLLVLLGACGSGDANDAAAGELAGTSWRLTAINGQAALPDAAVTLQFDAARASGSGGCNQYSGAYSRSGTSLSIEQVTSTLMACAQPILDQESAYFNALNAVTSYQLSGDQLELFTGGAQPALVFSR